MAEHVIAEEAKEITRELAEGGPKISLSIAMALIAMTVAGATAWYTQKERVDMLEGRTAHTERMICLISGRMGIVDVDCRCILTGKCDSPGKETVDP